MCNGNVSISARKKVLKLVHDMAIYRAKTGFYGESAMSQLKDLMKAWIDELAEEHAPSRCRHCGESKESQHNFMTTRWDE